VLPAADGGQGILGLLRGQRPTGDATEAVMDVEGPVAALAELAVADDVDARLGLLAHDRVDRLLQTNLVGGFVVGLAILDLAQELDELRGPDQAADVGCEDAVGGRCHFAPSRFLARFLVSLSPADRPGSNGWARRRKKFGESNLFPFVPAKAGTQPIARRRRERTRLWPWIPAFAGMNADLLRGG